MAAAYNAEVSLRPDDPGKMIAPNLTKPLLTCQLPKGYLPLAENVPPGTGKWCYPRPCPSGFLLVMAVWAGSAGSLHPLSKNPGKLLFLL